jgi:peptide/nickel transport system substrate-binding protein
MRPADGVPSAIDLERSHMHRRLWLSVFMAALGALLLVVAGFAHASSSAAAKKKGGTLRLNMSDTDLDFSDPSLSYFVIGWQVEYATGMKLINYPDKPAPVGSRLIPEAAAAMPVISNNGRTYTFTIRKGLRFSDGSAISAKNFKWAIDRSATKAQQSPATPFMDDVVGYTSALNGGKNPAHVSGAIARGNKFILKLTHADGGMLAKLAMPFFQAISLKTKVDPHGVTVYPSGGPYYISSYIRNRRLVLKKNKFYKGNRPRNIDTFDIDINTDVDQSLLQVRSNQRDYDMAGLPPSAHADLA